MRNVRGSTCIFEARPTKYKFGTKNYGEIPRWINTADGDPWDVFAPGYLLHLPPQRAYKIKDVIGVFKLYDGNFKIAVRLHVPGYDAAVALREIKNYCSKYSEYTKIPGYFEFST